MPSRVLKTGSFLMNRDYLFFLVPGAGKSMIEGPHLVRAFLVCGNLVEGTRGEREKGG